MNVKTRWITPVPPCTPGFMLFVRQPRDTVGLVNIVMEAVTACNGLV